MADEGIKEQIKQNPLSKPYTVDNLKKRKAEDEERIKLLLEKPAIKILDKLPITQEDINQTKLKLARDLLARERAAEREKIKSGRDPLTGLLNRRAFSERLIYEIARSAREKKPFGLISLDFDNFKEINDQYGHDVGDQVLMELGKSLLEQNEAKKALRVVDTPARMGGEEFSIIVPEITDHEVLVFTAKRIKQVIEERLSSIEEVARKGRKITTSIGTTLYEPFTKTETANEAMKRLKKEADIALYEAKSKGRDRVEVYA